MYMKDDRQVHELSYIFAASLFDIRSRSEALRSTCEEFLHNPGRTRLEMVNKLTQYKQAFDIVDVSGDGSIEQAELEYLLKRFTADAQTDWEDGIKTKNPWAEAVYVRSAFANACATVIIGVAIVVRGTDP
eukprot:COSAG02_NODE_332_length_24474_cov_23.190949_22_plen_131_part_00